MPTDLYWTLDGDIAVGRNGDLRDTSYDPLRTFFQEIRTRCRSALRDWATQPSLGADLDDLIGRPNNKFTAEEGRTKITSALMMGGFLARKQIQVKYVPISRHQIAYFISVNLYNPQMGQTRMLKTQLLFDTQESDLKVI